LTTRTGARHLDPVTRPTIRRVPAAVALLALAAGVARAHWDTPADVVAALDAPVMHHAYDVVHAARDAALPRLLVVRVGPGWRTLSDDARRRAADDWLALWRHAVPQGIVGVLDDATGRPVVNYDAAGNARLVAP
jgi:hypothetical protein